MAFNLDQFVDLTADGKGIVVPIDELKCSICLNVFNNAVDTRCGHIFCDHCLREWRSKPGPAVKRCPQCREALTATKRTRDMTANESDIGDVVKANRDLNRIIGRLRIKCQYEWNGCNEKIQLESKAAHHNNCKHRLCRKCGHPAGESAGQHNCIELLVKDRKVFMEYSNEWKHKFEAVVKEKEEIKEKLAKMCANCVDSISLTFDHMIDVKEIFVGKHRFTDLKMRLRDDGITLWNAEHYTNQCSRVYMSVRYAELQSLAICADSSLPLLVIKPVGAKTLEIAKSLSIDSHVFDVNSNDKSLNTIVIVLNNEWIQLLTTLVLYSCQLKNSRSECMRIDAIEGRVLLDNRSETYG
ncbi:unnamed protein product [Medioppia subpectinata]|uniref:RING-type domain-containing protein n=1 Tax=Medioppia subpectinata TaxID=1979941 RepID=A0A7R9KRB6_9ACAR|nr:unnamed protein product [Medioppia subpectinata]CAG2108389.1 unnamed protein product [Medioppia subpectinata]